MILILLIFFLKLYIRQAIETKIKTEIENKIPNVADFIKKAKLTELENKIPDISNLVNKTDYNTKVTEIENKLNIHKHDKYINTQAFKKLTANVFNARIAQANLITKTEFDSKLSSLHRKITSKKTKHLLVQNELNKLNIFDSSYFIGKSHFEENDTQNYLVFQPINRCFKVNMINNDAYILLWKSKGLYAESIKPPSTSDNSLTPELSYYSTKTGIKFTGSCLKQSTISYTHLKIVNT